MRKNQCEVSNRAQASRRDVAGLVYFSPQEVVFESRMLASGVGYLRFNMWVIPQGQKVRRAVREFAGAKGIIIDLRGNPGGIGGLAPGVAGLLVNERTSLGSMNMRNSEQKFSFTRRLTILARLYLPLRHGLYHRGCASNAGDMTPKIAETSAARCCVRSTR